MPPRDGKRPGDKPGFTKGEMALKEKANAELRLQVGKLQRELAVKDNKLDQVEHGAAKVVALSKDLEQRLKVAEEAAAKSKMLERRVAEAEAAAGMTERTHAKLNEADARIAGLHADNAGIQRKFQEVSKKLENQAVLKTRLDRAESEACEVKGLKERLREAEKACIL